MKHYNSQKYSTRPAVLMNVVNCRTQELRKLGYNSLIDFLDADPNHLYVGRNMTRYVPGATTSKWHNPFTLHNYNNDAELVVQLFTIYIKNGPLYNDLHELEGKTLACWCY